MTRGLIRCAFIGAMLAMLAVASADTLRTNDGRVFQGRHIKTEGGVVTFEVHKYGAKMQVTFKESEVKSITKGDAPTQDPTQKDDGKEADPGLGAEPEPPAVVTYDKPNYYVVPFQGEVGVTARADLLERYFADAAKRNPTLVVFYVDSPGGYIKEVEKLVDVIKKYKKKVKMVAYVKSAISAAAITTLSIPEIYVERGSVFGAATAWQTSPWGTPAAVSEKFQSIWRAQARAVAEEGGHSPLLADAMIDNTIELHMVKDAKGNAKIMRGKGRYIVSAKDRLLTLTSTEAERVGLAKAIVENMDELGGKLGHDEWVECEGLAKPLAEHWRKKLEAFNEKMDEYGKEYSSNMRKARDNDPHNYELHDYSIDSRGRLSHASRRKWRQQSGLCVMYLTKAEKAVKGAIQLMGEMEEYKEMREYLKDEIHERIKEYKTRILKGMDRTTLPGNPASIRRRR